MDTNMLQWPPSFTLSSKAKQRKTKTRASKQKPTQKQTYKKKKQKKQTNQDLIETGRSKQVCTEGKGYFPHSLTSVIKTSTIALRPNPQILSKFNRCSLQPKMYKNYDVWTDGHRPPWCVGWWWQIIFVGNGKKKKRKKQTSKQTNRSVGPLAHYPYRDGTFCFSSCRLGGVDACLSRRPSQSRGTSW